MSDNIADLLTRIRNGQKSKLLQVKVYKSNFKQSVLKVLLEEGYISGYKDLDENHLIIDLKYSSTGSPAIAEIHRVSKPGTRMYSSIKDLKSYYNGMGIYVLSTSKGVMSDRGAKKMMVGGEVVCKVF
jgi:small subunit ribosomal protein S8